MFRDNDSIDIKKRIEPFSEPLEVSTVVVVALSKSQKEGGTRLDVSCHKCRRNHRIEPLMR